MSVQTEIDRISTAVQNAHLKVIEKGGTSAAPYLVANLPDAIDTIPEATAPKLQAKTATPSETAQTVKPDSGYDGLSSVAVGAISKTYVGSSVPKQAAQTITPGTANKTIASGRYLTGTQTIKGDANLVAGNIKSGVSIFGVAGTMTTGEDVTAETNTYTSLLDDLEAAVDALPDAGSGGGASVETCTVTGEGFEGEIYYSDGTQVISDAESFYFGNPVIVAKNSVLVFVPFYPMDEMANLTISGDAEVMYSDTTLLVVAIYGNCEIGNTSGGGLM